MGTKYVKYTGLSHVRAILLEEWRRVGVTDQKGVIWNRANNWMVPLADFTDAAWPYIDGDSELVVVEVDRTTKPADDTPPSDVVTQEVTTQTTGGEVITADADGNQLN